MFPFKNAMAKSILKDCPGNKKERTPTCAEPVLLRNRCALEFGPPAKGLANIPNALLEVSMFPKPSKAELAKKRPAFPPFAFSNKSQVVKPVPALLPFVHEP